MRAIVDVSWLSLSLGYSLLLIPFLLFWHYKTGLIKDTIIAIVRMTVQLFLVGVYLEWLFGLNDIWINILWAFIMVLTATLTTIKRSKLRLKLFILPVFISLFFSLLIVDTFFLGWVIQLDYIFDAQYFIPITGMIIGNSMGNNIIALQSFYGQIRKDKLLYNYALANGSTHHEAILPFMRQALQYSFNPLIGTIAVMGLISLPGMMTGQILGGTDPSIAIKYQIIISLTILIAASLSIYITIRLSNLIVFDSFGNLSTQILPNKRKTNKNHENGKK